ncbi:hypothetical protein BGX27_010621 [Mortierella sp. AM989]|nr:hypothetical protein BGX27_010621 [Mortierella sp. AM989]
MIARTFILIIAVALSAITLFAQGTVIVVPAIQQQDIVQRDIPMAASDAVSAQTQVMEFLRREDNKNIIMESESPESIKPVVKAACEDDDDGDDDDDSESESRHGHRDHNRDGHGHNVATGPSMTDTSAHPTITAEPSSGSVVKFTRNGVAVGLAAVVLAAYMA